MVELHVANVVVAGSSPVSRSFKVFFTYIIYSTARDRYYVGHCEDINLRLERHNLGFTRSTKSGVPWNMMYYETFETRVEAIRREREIKRWKSRRMIEDLIRSACE